MDLPKLVITDIDGVWTDGGMYYTESGEEFKKFNTSDSAGVLFLKIIGVPIAIITGENTSIVAHRANKLGIDLLEMGVHDKLSVAKTLCIDLEINIKDVAYIGDDINDINLLREVGFSCCPDNAPQFIKTDVDLVTFKKGGEGAFREFVETILIRCGKFEEALHKYLIQKGIDEN